MYFLVKQCLYIPKLYEKTVLQDKNKVFCWIAQNQFGIFCNATTLGNFFFFKNQLAMIVIGMFEMKIFKGNVFKHFIFAQYEKLKNDDGAPSTI